MLVLLNTKVRHPWASMEASRVREPAEVYLPVPQWFGHGFTHCLEAGEVDHGVDWLSGCSGISKQLIKQGGIAHIAFHQLHRATGQLCDAIKGHR